MIERIGSLLFALVVSMPASGQAYEYWRGVLESPGGDLPFCFGGVARPTHLHHGVEVKRVRAWREPSDGFRFPSYDSWIDVKPADGDATGQRFGVWHKVTRTGEVTMPFRLDRWPLEARSIGGRDPEAGLRVGPTFPLTGKTLDVSGRWRVQFAQDSHPAVAIFERNRAPYALAPGEIAGTFLTVTGDYRYLAGTSRGKEMRLACFDGAHAFLFHAKMQPDGTLSGDFWSSTNWHDTWVAHRDDKAALPDAFTLTVSKPEIVLGDLVYPDVDTGKATKLSDLFGKTTLVVLFGTWCPNCGDSGSFLQGLLARNHKRGLRIVGLAFEHGDDSERHARVVGAYRERYGAEWPILLAGSSDKKKASAAFPAVTAVRSYPTTLFVDAAGTVRAVHQGFAGPATGAAYGAQCKSFEALVQRLLAESKPVRK